MTKYYKTNEPTTLSYTLTSLTPQLLLISWRRTPIMEEARAFIQTLHDLLNEAPTPLYFISDLRRGRIVDARIIHQLSQLTHHPNWGGSTAFSQNPISKIFLGSFQRMLDTNSDKNRTFDQPEDAIAFLDHLVAGLGENINWSYVLDNGTGLLRIDS